LIHKLSGLPLIKDRLTHLDKKYICVLEGRSELMELLVSEYNADKSAIKKRQQDYSSLSFFNGML